MKNKKRIIIGFILICLVCVGGFYGYSYINQKNFKLSEANWDADAKFWSEYPKINGYDIKFETLHGKVVEEVVCKKESYNMKIDTVVKNGEFNIKIYNDERVLLDKKNPINENISVSKEDSKNLKIEFLGENAENGEVKFKLS